MLSGDLEVCGGHTRNLKAVCYIINFVTPVFIICTCFGLTALRNGTRDKYSKILFVHFSGFCRIKSMTRENMSPDLTFFNLKQVRSSIYWPKKVFCRCFESCSRTPYFSVNGSTFVACSTCYKRVQTLLGPTKTLPHPSSCALFLWLLFCYRKRGCLL